MSEKEIEKLEAELKRLDKIVDKIVKTQDRIASIKEEVLRVRSRLSKEDRLRIATMLEVVNIILHEAIDIIGEVGEEIQMEIDCLKHGDEWEDDEEW